MMAKIFHALQWLSRAPQRSGHYLNNAVRPTIGAFYEEMADRFGPVLGQFGRLRPSSSPGPRWLLVESRPRLWLRSTHTIFAACARRPPHLLALV